MAAIATARTRGGATQVASFLATGSQQGAAVFYPWMFARRKVIYDALHLFVHSDGYRLSDRVWRANQQVRNRIDHLLAYHIRAGTSAVDIAKELEGFLQRERRGVRTKKPYGTWGSYDARRLARTEITAAHGRAAMAWADANPFVQTMAWALSAFRDAWDCDCEENAGTDIGYGPGVYPIEMVPDYPAHPHCMCNLQPQAVADSSQVVADLEAWLAGGESRQDYGRLLDLSGLVYELMALWGMRQIGG